MPLSERADMYTALAEAMAEPPQWMCLPGREWPLFDLAVQLLPNSAALPVMALIQEELLTARMARYTNLSSGQAGQPHFWLYESAFLTGRILGQSTFDVAKCYSQAGLEVDGSELPDGAAPELAFLAFLACSDPGAEKDFLKNHAARWLPALGQTSWPHGGDDPAGGRINPGRQVGEEPLHGGRDHQQDAGRHRLRQHRFDRRQSCDRTENEGDRL